MQKALLLQPLLMTCALPYIALAAASSVQRFGSNFSDDLRFGSNFSVDMRYNQYMRMRESVKKIKPY
jgi:hypothetical protein